MHTQTQTTQTHSRPDLRLVAARANRAPASSVSLMGFSRRELQRLVAEMID